MSGTVLVAYGSRYGSAREVAADVAATLEASGLEVELRPASEVQSVDGYAAVVLGAGIYVGRMHADVRKLLRRHRTQLAARPLAVFALGPIGDVAKQLPDVRRRVDTELAKLTDAPPVAVAVFGGVVAPERMHFPFSRMRPFDGRDWREIRSWSRTLALQLGTGDASRRLRAGTRGSLAPSRVRSRGAGSRSCPRRSA